MTCQQDSERAERWPNGGWTREVIVWTLEGLEEQKVDFEET
jgi:hypothetical protein